MLSSGGKMDGDLKTVLSRPLPAVLSLVLGALLGLTGGAALGGGGGDAERATAPVAVAPATTGAADAAEQARDAQGERDVEPPREEEPKEREPQRPKSLAAAVASLEPLIEGTSTRIGVAVAPLDGGQIRTAGDDGSFQAWSTMKVPVIATFLQAHPQPTAKNSQDIQTGIVQSSNEGPRALYQQLIRESEIPGANAALQAMLNEGGAQINGLPTQLDPSINSVAFGQSSWSPRAAASFFRSLANGCLPISEDNARTVLTHMNAVSNGRWGLFDALPNDRLFVKGGWGPDSTGGGAWTVSQIGVVGRGEDGYVLAAMTEPGSEEAGHQLLRRIAARLVKATGNPSKGRRLPRRCPR